MTNPAKSDTKESGVFGKLRGIFAFGSNKPSDEATEAEANPFSSKPPLSESSKLNEISDQQHSTPVKS